MRSAISSALVILTGVLSPSGPESSITSGGADDELGCFGANPGWIYLSWSCDFSRIVSAAASAAVSSACSAFSFARWYSALPT